MSSISNALPVGTLLSSAGQTYRVVSVLGSGGFGITYLVQAQVVQDGRVHSFYYAMKEHFMSSCCERQSGNSKVMFSNPVADQVQNSLRDFIAEAERLRKVGGRHENIVKVKEIFQQNNTAYYIMEYLEGDSLRKYVKGKGKLTPEETRKLMEPIVDAVGYLHANKMTHLDIKPDNIMLTAAPNGGLRPVLIDFGLSKHYDEHGTPTSTINTLGCSDGFSPIEQYGGITTFSPTADIYALGATMAYCLTGQNPTKATDMEPSESMRFASGFGSVGRAVSKMMKGARAERPQTIKEVNNILNSSAPVPPPPPPGPVPPTPGPVPPTPVPGPKPGKKGSNKGLIIGGCAVGALALIGGAIALFGGEDSNTSEYDEIGTYYNAEVSSGATLPYPYELSESNAPVAVSLQWGRDVDLDLYVVQPDGQIINFLNTEISDTQASFSGDATSLADRKVETVTWYAPMSGTYEVYVRCYSEPDSEVTSYIGIRDGSMALSTPTLPPSTHL